MQRHVARCLALLLLCNLVALPCGAQQMTGVNLGHPLAQGLVGWWRGLLGFTGGLQLYDLMRGSTGSCTNMGSGYGPTLGWSTTTRQGGLAQLNFDGSTAVVGLGNPPSSVDLPQKTLCAWINPVGFGGNGLGRILDKRSASGWSFFLGSGTSSLAFNVDWTTGASFSASNAITLGVWQHVAVVYDTTSASNVPTFYVNGLVVATNPPTAPTGSPTSDANSSLLIGNNDASTGGRGFQGAIDDVRIYNRLLSAGEIAQVWALGLQGDPGLLASPLQTLVLLLPAPAGGNPSFLPFFQPLHPRP